MECQILLKAPISIKYLKMLHSYLLNKFMIILNIKLQFDLKYAVFVPMYQIWQFLIIPNIIHLKVINVLFIRKTYEPKWTKIFLSLVLNSFKFLIHTSNMLFYRVIIVFLFLNIFFSKTVISFSISFIWFQRCFMVNK